MDWVGGLSALWVGNGGAGPDWLGLLMRLSDTLERPRELSCRVSR